MAYVSKTFPPDEVRHLCSLIRKHGQFKKEREVAFYIGITAAYLTSIKCQGGGKKAKAKFQAALDRVRKEYGDTDQALVTVDTPCTKTMSVPIDMPEVDPRGPNGDVLRLILMHRSLPEDQRTLGRAATPEERAAFLRRRKWGRSE